MRTLFALLLLIVVGAGCRSASAVSLVGSKTDALVLSPLGAAPICPAGLHCTYALTGDGERYDVDGAGVTLKAHAAKGFRPSSNCAALASPQNGDVCYDTTAGSFRYYSAGWLTGSTNDALVVHKAGNETVTGAKTFTTSVALTGGAVLGADLEGGGNVGTGFAQGSAAGELLTAGRQLLTSAPLTGGGALTADRTLGLSVSAPLQVAGGSLGVAAASLSYTPITAGATGALGAGTTYLTAPGQSGSATEVRLAKPARAVTARNLYCEVSTAPGGADTVAVTVRAAGSDTAVTCSIAAAATVCSDLSHTAALTAGQAVSIKAVTSGGAAADVTCSLELTN